ncbi:hypothetical protein D9615_010572 [Tricholomella constricta]|uniref:Asl1-like glycosyl hydrolase catalytic domain-containing protein n=1 Tax=Tricholomella constricta TaxID=117010 RepID=A0A8H5GN56_9AGAR|nr:hypothetical protein D9615_010572 [Tricholomella constricta]
MDVYTWSPYIPQKAKELGFEPITMLWGEKQTSEFKRLVVKGYAKTVFSFNKPNQQGQSDMSPQRGAQLWQQYIQPLKAQGYSLTSPACTNAPSGKKWLQDFFAACHGCTTSTTPQGHQQVILLHLKCNFSHTCLPEASKGGTGLLLDTLKATSEYAPSTPSNTLTASQAANCAIEDPVAEVARLKRTILDLKESLSPAGPNKRPTSTITLGRGIRRLVTLFQDLPTLIREADRREEEEESDEESDEGSNTEEDSPVDPAQLQRERDRTFAAFQHLAELIPGFKTKLLNTDGAVIASYLSNLTRGANDARSDDVSSIKKSVAIWLNQSPKTQPPLNPDDRALRGLQHDTTGALLCPLEYDWDDKEYDFTVRTKLRTCEDGFDVYSSFYARCFYKSGKGDLEDVEKGFLRGSLLVKTFSTIFMSPSSANSIVDDRENDENADDFRAHFSQPTASRKATKSCVAKKLRLEAITPRAIAYAAVLLHFSLTDAPHWKPIYNGFSYELLYNFIVDFFEDIEGVQAKARAKSLLKWWNKNALFRQIFPVRAAAVANSRASINKLKAQRARNEVEYEAAD